MTIAVCFRSLTKDRSITNVSSTGSGCRGVLRLQILTKIKNGKTAFPVSADLFVTLVPISRCFCFLRRKN